MNFLFAINLTSIILQGSIINTFSENYTQISNPFHCSCIERESICPLQGK